MIRRRFFLGAIVVLASLQPINAQIIDRRSWAYSGSLPDAWFTFTLPKFDYHLTSTNIGPESLVGVRILVGPNQTGSDISIGGGISLFNSGTEDLTLSGISYGFETEAVTPGTGYTGTSQTLDPLGISSSLPATIAPNSGFNTGVATPQVFSGVTHVVSPGDVQNFLASSTGETFEMRTRAPLLLTTSHPDFSIGLRPSFSPVFTVEYTFNLIPEPSSAMLISAASLVLVMRRRRM
jgi:hypothetical protein